MSKKLFLLIIASIVFFGGVGVSAKTAWASSSGCSGSHAAGTLDCYGRAAQGTTVYGYFTGASASVFSHAGFVLQQGLLPITGGSCDYITNECTGASIPSAASLEDYIYCLYNGSGHATLTNSKKTCKDRFGSGAFAENYTGQNKHGAAFIVNTMLGNKAPGSYSVSSSMWSDWQARVDASSISKANDLAYGNGINSAYFTDIGDDAFYHTSGSGDSIVLTSGGEKYILQIVCANPIGDTQGLPKPAPPPVQNSPPTGSVTATCSRDFSTNATTYTFKYNFSDSDGSSGTPTVGFLSAGLYPASDTSHALSGSYQTASYKSWSGTFSYTGSWPGTIAGIYHYIWLRVADIQPDGSQNWISISPGAPAPSCPAANSSPTGSLSVSCALDSSGTTYTFKYNFSDSDGRSDAAAAGYLFQGGDSSYKSLSYTTASSPYKSGTGTWTVSGKWPGYDKSGILHYIWLRVTDVYPDGSHAWVTADSAPPPTCYPTKTNPPAVTCNDKGIDLSYYQRSIPPATTYQGMAVHIMTGGGGYDRYPTDPASAGVTAAKYYAFTTLDPNYPPDWSNVTYQVYTKYVDSTGKPGFDGYTSVTAGPCGQATCTPNSTNITGAEFGSKDSFTVTASYRNATTAPPGPNKGGFAVSIYDASTNNQVWNWATAGSGGTPQYTGFKTNGTSLTSDPISWSHVPGPGNYYIQWRFGANGINWGQDYKYGNGSVSCTSATVMVAYKPYVNFFGGDVYAGGAFANGDDKCTKETMAQSNIEAFVNGSGTLASGSGSQFAALAEGDIDGFGSAMMRNDDPNNPPSPLTGLMFSNTNSGNLKSPNHCIPDYYDSKDNVPNLQPITNTSFSIGQTLDGAYFYDKNKTHSSTLTITSSALGAGGGVGQGKDVVIYVNGNVYINAPYGIVYYGGSKFWKAPSDIPSLYIIANGNINVAPSVGQLDGVYVAQNGTINTCAKSDGTHDTFSNCASQLTINGAFIDGQTNLYRTSSTLYNSVHGEYPTNPPGKCDYKYPASHTDTSYDCAAEIFRFGPEIYLSNPAMPPLGGGAVKFDAIQSLSPVL